MSRDLSVEVKNGYLLLMIFFSGMTFVGGTGTVVCRHGIFLSFEAFGRHVSEKSNAPWRLGTLERLHAFNWGILVILSLV